MGRSLLVVGFGPFPGVPRNPSARLARAVAAQPRLRRVLGRAPRCLVLRTAYAAISDTFEPALATGPDAVLMIGVAKRSRHLRVETRARNRASRLLPDASGRIAPRPVLDPHGPAERRSPHAARALATLRRTGLDARLSRDAGRYLCNACYYRALAERRPALFIHIPPPSAGRPGRAVARRRPSIDAQAEAIAQVAVGLLATARAA